MTETRESLHTFFWITRYIREPIFYNHNEQLRNYIPNTNVCIYTPKTKSNTYTNNQPWFTHKKPEGKQNLRKAERTDQDQSNNDHRRETHQEASPRARRAQRSRI